MIKYDLNCRPVTMQIPSKTRNNGTLFLHVIVVPQFKRKSYSYNELQKVELFNMHSV